MYAKNPRKLPFKLLPMKGISLLLTASLLITPLSQAVLADDGYAIAEAEAVDIEEPGEDIITEACDITGTDANIITDTDNDIVTDSTANVQLVGTGMMPTSSTEEDTADSVSRTAILADNLYNAMSKIITRDNNGNLTITNRTRTDYTTGQFIWDTEWKDFSWTYYNGIMMSAFLMLDADNYMGNVSAFYKSNVANDGKANNKTSSKNNYRTNELDSMPPARALFELIRSDSISAADKNKYRKMIDYVYSVMLDFETSDGAGGNFKHKMNNDNWETYQVALDGLYMAQPFFMELANALDDGTLTANDFQLYTPQANNYNAPPSSDEIYSDVVSRMLWIGDNLYVPGVKLYSHGWGPMAGLNSQYWLRAVGWYAAALADVIGMLPADYTEEKDALIAIEKQLFDGMMEYQDEETGMWYNVINYGSELTGTASQNELETSGTALIAYAMMKSYVEGYLDDTYGEAGLRAFNGTAINYLDDEGLHNVYISSGVETRPEGYLSKDYRLNEAKGAGPMIMASTYAAKAARIHNNPDYELRGNEDIVLGLNETPDFSGILLAVLYDNGTECLIPSEELSFGGYDPTVPGMQEVPIYYNDAEYGTVNLIYEEPTAVAPAFMKNSLILTGEIGVNFFMNLPGDIAQYEGSYVTFTYNDEESTEYFDENHKNSDGTLYGFTCHVNSLQMAEEITAVFHYGENFGETVETTYSVLTYITAVLGDADFTQEVRDVVQAIADYGYYAQQYLFRINGPGLDEKYEPMPQEIVSADDITLTAFSGDPGQYQASKNLGDSKLSRITFSLALDSNTSLKINLYPKSGYKGTPTATVDGSPITVSRNGSKFLIVITGIPAHLLGEMYHVDINADGSASMDVSALSYAYALFNVENQKEDAKNVAAALYQYYEKCLALQAAMGS